MKKVRCPVNVVCFGKGGQATNHGCAGPEQLRTWLAEGRINSLSQVWVESTKTWMSADTYLGWADRRSDSEQIHDMDATLTNLLDVAEELKLMARMRNGNGRSRDERKHREAERSNGDANYDDDDDCETIRGTVSGAYSH